MQNGMLHLPWNTLRHNKLPSSMKVLAQRKSLHVTPLHTYLTHMQHTHNQTINMYFKKMNSKCLRKYQWLARGPSWLRCCGASLVISRDCVKAGESCFSKLFSDSHKHAIEYAPIQTQCIHINMCTHTNKLNIFKMEKSEIFHTCSRS